MTYAASVSSLMRSASSAITLIGASCCSTRRLICTREVRDVAVKQNNIEQTSLNSAANSVSVFSIRLISSCRS